MTTASAIPITRDELEGDEALETLRRCGRGKLVVDAIKRFRAADGFSHSRALALQLTLTILPALIAVVGLAAALDEEQVRKVVKATLEAIAPGPASDILNRALEQGSSAAAAESGETAVVAGGFAALLAGTTAMAQVERGANRIYGVERDRPFLRKYSNALVLALTAGAAGVGAVVLIVAGSEIRRSVGFGDTLSAVWTILRWPLGLGLALTAVALLFERAPRRRQPEPSWLAVGALVTAGLFLCSLGLLSLYVNVAGSFGETYGPIAGTIGLLLWTFLTACALFGGLAFAAQLEAVRAGVRDPQVERESN